MDTKPLANITKKLRPKEKFTLYIDAEMKKKAKKMAIDHNVTFGEFMEGAINLLFEKIEGASKPKR